MQDRTLPACDSGGSSDAEVGIPAHAVVEGEAVGDAPRITEPEAQRRPRHVDVPVAEVLVEALDVGVETGRFHRRVVPGAGRESGVEVGRPLLKTKRRRDSNGQ